jgi:hypothetical protein
MNRGTVAFAIGPVCAGIGAHASWTRQANLRGSSRLKSQGWAAMWRDHYEKRYAALFSRLYEALRTTVRFCAAGQLSNRAGRDSGRQGVSVDRFARGRDRRATDTKKPRTMPGLLSY